MRKKRVAQKSVAARPAIRRVSVPVLRRAIQTLPADKPVKQADVWYLTQKEHWLGWLKYYNTEGAYGRIPGLNRDARYAYNHIVCPPMLLWLASAAGVKASRVRAATREAAKYERMPAQAAAIRRHMPWKFVAEALWPTKPGARREGGRLRLGRRRRPRRRPRAAGLAGSRSGIVRTTPSA